MTFEDFSREWRSGAPVIEAHTSGSTGTPKRICLERDFVVKSACATNRFFGIGPGSSLHSCVAADFIGGKMMFVRADIAGCRFSSEIPSNRPFGGILPARLTLVAVVPSQMRDILRRHAALRAGDTALAPPPAVDNYLIGGSPIPTDLRVAIGESGLRCFESYGMTETASHIALRRVEASEEPTPFRPIRDDIALSSDARGCLVIDFPDFGKSIVTNDIVVFHPDGGFSIRGRADDVIISGGRKIHPADVERRLSAAVGGDFAICGVPHPLWGEAVVAVATDRETLDAIGREARNHLEPWERPKAFRIVGELPLTSGGKLARNRLRSDLAGICIF